MGTGQLGKLRAIFPSASTAYTEEEEKEGNLQRSNNKELTTQRFQKH